MAEALAETVDLLIRLARAATVRAIYPRGHPSVDVSVRQLLAGLEGCLDRRGTDEVTFLVIDDDVIVDDRPLRTRSLHLRPFVRIMHRLGIQRFTLARGFTEDEGQQLLGALADKEPVLSSPHLVLGRVELAAGGEGGSGPGEVELSEEDLDRGGEAFAGMEPGRRGSIEDLDRLVWRIVQGLASSSRSLLLLAPVRSFDQQLFLHSVNVSALAVSLARSLGVEGETLHEIGLAALLHDVGKMQLPQGLWHREGRLEGRSWEVAQLHPELGAASLCGAPGVPPLAVLVAYEHHLRWDGKPSYPACERLPNLASQITAVADTWDTLASAAGGPGEISRRAALEVWQERSGTHLDPLLVGSFLLLLSEAGEGPA